MSAEIKTSRHTVESRLSKSLKAKFKKLCKKQKESVSQRLRDLIQADVKNNS